MAAVKPLEPEKPVDRVGFEPLMLAVRKARAMALVLEKLGEPEEAYNELVAPIKDDEFPEDTHAWLHAVVGAALIAAIDDIEREYRKLETGGRLTREHNLHAAGASSREQARDQRRMSSLRAGRS